MLLGILGSIVFGVSEIFGSKKFLQDRFQKYLDQNFLIALKIRLVFLVRNHFIGKSRLKKCKNEQKEGTGQAHIKEFTRIKKKHFEGFENNKTI